MWVDNKEPQMNTFLRPFVQQANNLFEKKIVWTSDERIVVRSRFVAFCCSADSKARYSIFNMSQYNAHYGCTICYYYGSYIEGSMRYPLTSHDEVRKRTHDGIIIDMRTAFENEQTIRGVCGPSELMNLQGFNLIRGQAIDVLHCIWIGVAQKHTNLLLKSVGYEYYINSDTKAIINQRLKVIKIPTILSRKPRSLEQMPKWKAIEWRNWLLFYAIPCLQGCIPQKYIDHLAMLSNTVFLLSQGVIRRQDLERARELMHRYIALYERYFDKRHIIYNIHLAEHLLECIEDLGPSWVHSTCGLESWNYKLRKMITSPKGIVQQIVSYQLRTLIARQMHNLELSLNVRQELQRVLFKKNLTEALQIEDVYLVTEKISRQPTPCERQALEQRNVHCENIYFFQKMVGSFGEIWTTNVDSRLNNYVLLWDNRFCRIEEIICFGEPFICGAFAVVLEISTYVNFATHIACVSRETDVVFIKPDEIRSLAFIIIIEETVFITSVSNHFEID